MNKKVRKIACFLEFMKAGGLFLGHFSFNTIFGNEGKYKRSLYLKKILLVFYNICYTQLEKTE